MTLSGTSRQFAAHPHDDRGRGHVAALLLILMDEIDRLRKLFSKVVVLAAAITELLHEDAPEAVRGWVANLPSWVSIQENPVRNTAGLVKLRRAASPICLQPSTGSGRLTPVFGGLAEGDPRSIHRPKDRAA